LRTGTVRATVLTAVGDLITKSLEQLPYSVQTGNSGFEKAFGMPFFEYLANHPADASLFSETMVGFHGSEAAAVAAAYDFSSKPSSTWVVRRVICSRQSSVAIPNRVAYSSTCRMLFAARPHLSRRAD